MALFLDCVFLILFIFGCHLVVAQEGATCDTPNGTGTCINIKNCTPLLNLLLSQSNNPQVRTLLRSSACGFAGNDPLVCCPRSQPNNNNNSNPVDNNVAKSYKLPKIPDCGRSNITNSRVVNGVKAKLGEFPWMVILGYKNSKNPDLPKWLCGGALITKRHILTAAHCVYNRPDLYLARLGELDLYDSDDGANPEDIRLIKAKIHEDYNSSTFTTDIAILKLEKEPTISSVWPVCLPIQESVRSKIGSSLGSFVAGWGSLSFRGAKSSSLQVARLPVLDNNACKRAYANQSIIDNRILCAGYLNGLKDACEGDSGGPLMMFDGYPDSKGLSVYEIGIVSYGFRCAEVGYPGVYTRVTSFLDWIEKNVD